MPSRAVLEGVLSLQACEELLLLARSLAVVGYREGVCSATIFEVAAALPSALIPLVAAREAVRAAVEEALGLELGLMVEFTGLICWRPGSRIGWHHDANRPYLRQRTHSAVCYLQRAGSDFGGGTFQFQLGSCGAAGPQDVLAAPGRVVAYDAQEEHGVTPVEWGERCALTLWFTDVLEHCEDSRLLAVLAGAPQHLLGLPSSMWLLEDGTDLQLCRLAMTGLALVHSGTLLHNAEAVPDGQEQQQCLQLAVQPAALRSWLAWKQRRPAAGNAEPADSAAADAAAGAAGTAGGAACSCAGVLQEAVQLVPGIEFGSVQQAVLALQRWAWRRCPGGWAREHVCSTHLRGPPEIQQQGRCVDACSCAWLRTCSLSSQGQASSELLPPGELAAAAAAEAHSQVAHQAALDGLLPRWLQLGALFAAD